ncbi:hypothetical protein ACSS6W_008940 [Trichoderma asperelloides]
MDTQGSTLNSPGHDDTYKIVFFPATDAVEADKELNAITSEKDETSQITLNTANAIPEPVQSQSTELVTKQPGVEPCMKPENYVIKPEYLEEAPDYIDCPYCKTRQKTEVRHQPTSQTKIAAAACCLFGGVIPVFVPFVCNWCTDTDHHCESCKSLVAHQPHEGKMEAVLPLVSDGVDSRYHSSQYADMSKQSQQKLEPTVVEADTGKP